MRQKIILLAALLLIIFNISRIQAQVSFGTDIFNRYIWRGLDLGGNSPSIQPWLKVSWTSKDSNNDISLGAWGAYTFSPTANQEADLFISYSYKSLITLMVTDYFFPGLNTGAKENYFEYNADSTGHVMEATLSFNGTKRIPFTLIYAMNFYGNDARKLNADTSTASIFMSKYLELGYKKSFDNFDFNLFVGMALDNPDEDLGEASYYLNKKAGIINLGFKAAKNIKVTDNFTMPMQFSLVTNPELKKIYFVLGLSL